MVDADTDMNLQLVGAVSFFAMGIVAFVLAMRHERLMQRERLPGVTYRAVTLRRGGGWRRTDLFTPLGLEHQRRASRYGLAGAALWLAALGLWIALGSR